MNQEGPFFRATLVVLPYDLAICRLSPDEPIPPETTGAGFWSLTRTADELSLILPQERVRAGWQAEGGWRCLQVVGPLDFELTGVLATFSTPLAKADIPVFALSTYDTDYLMVRHTLLAKACAVLSSHGHTVLYGSGA